MDLYEHQGKEIFQRHGIALIPREVARSPAEARAAAGPGGRREPGPPPRRIMEGGFQGTPVTRVLVERLVDIDQEFYVAITLDRSAGRYVAMTSTEGGVDIEEVAASSPEAIRRGAIDPLLG